MKLNDMRIFAIFASLIMLTMVAVPMVAARRTEPITIQPITTFEDAITIAERFLQVNPDGTLTLNMPIRMIRSIGRDHYDQLQAGITQTNKMISQGYLKFDENFDAYVTEKYLDKVKANTILYQESLTQEELQQLGDISVSISGNSITTIGILGGVTRITWHWWGFRIYLCSNTINGLALGTICVFILAGTLVLLGLISPKAALAASMIVAMAGALRIICGGRGVRISFAVRPMLPTPILLITDIRQQ